MIHKLDAWGNELLRWSAEPLAHTPTTVAVRAFFHKTVTTFYTAFCPGDRLHEYYYGDRWYNVFALYDGDTERLKGWYCNISRPAQIAADVVYWSDLALDVWASPDSPPLVLDEEEFAALALPETEARACRQALAAVCELALRGQLPR